MILHRLAQSIRRQDWTAALAAVTPHWQRSGLVFCIWREMHDTRPEHPARFVKLKLRVSPHAAHTPDTA